MRTDSGRAAVDADGQEIKEDSVVVDDVFGEGTTHAIVPLRMLMVSRHAHRLAPSAESMCRRQVAADNLR